MLNRNDHRIELIVNEAQKAWSFLLYILPPAGIGWFSVVTHLTLSNAHEKRSAKENDRSRRGSRTDGEEHNAGRREKRAFPKLLREKERERNGLQGVGMGS
jgi:hypothetical protein